MPAVSVTISAPSPGTTIPTVAPPSPAGHMSGTYTLDNLPLDKIMCRIVYPATTGMMATQIVVERQADILPGGKWRVDFGAIQQGLDTCMQAEIFVQTIAARQDSDTIEDVDIMNAPVGTMNPPVPIPSPIATIP